MGSDAGSLRHLFPSKQNCITPYSARSPAAEPDGARQLRGDPSRRHRAGNGGLCNANGLQSLQETAAVTDSKLDGAHVCRRSVNHRGQQQVPQPVRARSVADNGTGQLHCLLSARPACAGIGSREKSDIAL